MTRDGNGGPVRTEDDLRQALATLESHAPSAVTVLARVRGAAGGGAGPDATTPTCRAMIPPAPCID